MVKPKRVPLSCARWLGLAADVPRLFERRGGRAVARSGGGLEAAAAAGSQGKHWVTSKPASQLARGLIRQAAEPCLGTEHAGGDAQPRTDPAQPPGDTTQYCGADSELLLLLPEPGCQTRCTLPGECQELCWRWL